MLTIKKTFVLSAVIAALFVYSGMKKLENNSVLDMHKALQISIFDISLRSQNGGDK